MDEIPIPADKIKPPPVLGRFMVQDDDGSYISDELPEPQIPNDEYVAGNGGGDPPRSGEYTDAVDREDAFRKVVNYSAVLSHQVDFLCCETLRMYDEKEAEVLQSIIESGVNYDFLGLNESHLNGAIKKDRCVLCKMGVFEMALKDADKESPFLMAKSTDLKLCGLVSEPEVMQAVTCVYNQTEKTRHKTEKRDPYYITTLQAYIHYYLHDTTNPKRAVIIDQIRTRHLAKQLFEGSIGVTADGQRVIRGGYVAQYHASAARTNSLSAEIVQRHAYVNVNMFGEDPLTGDPLLRQGKTDGGKTQKRFAGTTAPIGIKKKQTFK